MSTFQYELLDRSTNQFRLLILEGAASPGKGKLATLRCQIVVTSLDLYIEHNADPLLYHFNALKLLISQKFLQNSTFSRPFYALSYVWGDPTLCREIEVNG